MLVEILRPAGAELARRWVACLLLAPESERAEIVASVERRMSELYLREPQGEQDAQRTVEVVHPPEQRHGFVEQKFASYTVKDGTATHETDESAGEHRA